MSSAEPITINQLPPELLAHIFIIGTETEIREEDGAWEEVEEDDDELSIDDIVEEEFDLKDLLMDGKKRYLPIRSASKKAPTPVSESSTSTSESLPVKAELPVTISHVCRHWRTVAIKTPMLWTSIDFSDGPPFEKSKTWIERSKDCDIDICIDFTDPDVLEEDFESSRPLSELMRIMDIATPHMHRWREFVLSVTNTEHMQAVLRTYLRT